jgi:hypothetical protein
MHLAEKDRKGWRGSENEKEHLQLASIYEHGSQGAREAATELRSKARELDDFKGSGKEETQRANLKLLGMMVAAQGGRLENHELRDYYNEMAQEDPEEAMKRVERLQELAAPLRTSQKRGYGLGFRTRTGRDGKPVYEAYDVYERPAGEEALRSFGRASSQDIANSKSEDLKDKDGNLSGWAQTIVAAASDTVYETKEVTDDYGNVHFVTRDTGVPKEGQAKLDAQAARAKIQSIEGYAQGDTGVGGQIYKIMETAGIQPKYGDPKGTVDPRTQHEAMAQQQQQAQAPDQGGGPPDPFARPGG